MQNTAYLAESEQRLEIKWLEFESTTFCLAVWFWASNTNLLSLNIFFFFENGYKNTFLSGLQAGALDLHSRCNVAQCYVTLPAEGFRETQCGLQEGKLGWALESDGEKEEEKACQDRLVRRMWLKWANDTLNRGPTYPRFYLLKSPPSQIWRYYYYSHFSDEKPEAMR